jgi:MFS family permease
MYPIIVAHANDHAEPGSYIQISGGLLLVFGIGSIIGPTVAGFAIMYFGASSLFAVTGVAHLMLIFFALLRLRLTPAVAQENKVTFQSGPLARASTPETATLTADEAEISAARAQSSDITDTVQQNENK